MSFSTPAALLLLLLALACNGAIPAAQPPIVLIVVDTLRADRMGCYGHTRATTPRIDELADDGIRFESAISQAPWTTPSVASLLSSRFPSDLGVRDVTTPVPTRSSWLPEVLQRAGYVTGAVVSHSFVSAKWGFARGFDSFDETNVKGQRAVTSKSVTDAAIAFVDAQHEKPFLLLAHYFDPHFALVEHREFDFQDPGEPYRGRVRSPVSYMLFGKPQLKLTADDTREMLRIYDSEIAFTDREIGRLLDHLRAQGVYERAVVVLTADHGEEYLDHGRLGHTRTLHDELIRVPLLLKLPGAAPRVETTPVALVDVFPTLLRAIGLEAPTDLVGIDLLAPRAGRAIFSETSRQAELRAVVRGSDKLVRDLQTGRDRLYDRARDPGEHHDVSVARPAVASELAALLDAWEAEHVPGEAPPPLELDDEERQRLRELGYGD